MSATSPSTRRTRARDDCGRSARGSRSAVVRNLSRDEQEHALVGGAREQPLDEPPRGERGKAGHQRDVVRRVAIAAVRCCRRSLIAWHRISSHTRATCFFVSADGPVVSTTQVAAAILSASGACARDARARLLLGDSRRARSGARAASPRRSTTTMSPSSAVCDAVLDEQRRLVHGHRHALGAQLAEPRLGARRRCADA